MNDTIEDLLTSKEEQREGFLRIALRKSKEAQYYLDLASALRVATSEYKNPRELLDNDELIESICDAAGISSKARHHLETSDIKTILEEFVETYLLSGDFLDELVNRYLLAQGDALGGRMRNIVGNMAAENFTANMVAALQIRNIEFSFLSKTSASWIGSDAFTVEHLHDIRALSWTQSAKPRLLVYNLTVPIVKKNIDVVLLSSNFDRDLSDKGFKDVLGNSSTYIALGELKGGIDPAGADEHWKTANTALERIRDSFKKEGQEVSTFFAGAAIEKAMAEEILTQVSLGHITKTANLSKKQQLEALCQWLISL